MAKETNHKYFIQQGLYDQFVVLPVTETGKTITYSSESDLFINIREDGKYSCSGRVVPFNFFEKIFPKVVKEQIHGVKIFLAIDQSSPSNQTLKIVNLIKEYGFDIRYVYEDKSESEKGRTVLVQKHN